MALRTSCISDSRDRPPGVWDQDHLAHIPKLVVIATDKLISPLGAVYYDAAYTEYFFTPCNHFKTPLTTPFLVPKISCSDSRSHEEKCIDD